MNTHKAETETLILKTLARMYREALDYGPRASTKWRADTIAKPCALPVRDVRNALKRLERRGLVRSIVLKTQSPRQARRNAWTPCAYYSITREGREQAQGL